MCGISGFFLSDTKNNVDSLKNELKKMNGKLSHRGPDNDDIWYNASDNIYLGHTRLSIIDLSKKANQPMESNNKRYVITFNGEIYNFMELKADLLKKKIKFYNKSDTQVLLEVINYYGLFDAIKKINGMFAFALWDKKEKKLFLVSDRLGKKPLYWSKIKNNIIFGSELKALMSFNLFTKEINFKTLESFLKFSYINSPETIFKNTYKLEPACIMQFNLKKYYTKKIYWGFNHFQENEFKIDQYILEKEITNLLEDSISKRMISDVPIGVMLSGGVDSSLVAALAQKQSLKKINTYSIAFKNKGYDESKYAKKISEILSTSHNEFTIDDYSIENLVEKIPYHYDEPFADSSQIPSMLISSELKKKVSVALTGDGGDEVFGGYSRYIWGDKVSQICGNFPIGVRNMFSKILLNISGEKLNKINEIFSHSVIPPQFGDRLTKVAKILKTKSNYEIYLKLITQMEDNILLKSFNKKKNEDFSNLFEKNHISTAMQIMDMKNYLPGDILVKIDRASMAHGLELRSPLLDYRLIEYCFKNLNTEHKIYKMKGKFFLRKILSKYIPINLINRPKMGFSVPLSKWLRKRLKNWMVETLNQDKLKKQNIFNYELVGKLMHNHLSEKNNNQHGLWNILMFQTWFDKWMR